MCMCTAVGEADIILDGYFNGTRPDPDDPIRKLKKPLGLNVNEASRMRVQITRLVKKKLGRDEKKAGKGYFKRKCDENDDFGPVTHYFLRAQMIAKIDYPQGPAL
ncbi:hypothetical protein PHYPSEUDO_009915 [Phytophthora pseudosyringae]|uniref:Uncharacterized protein n=1 Tax=Phytophthora pseudosyringae TaxID=221518 RepID=A0A8T1VBD4_9STRA|nr:hypothetical protein PHYPSEUDO_009915 [Phytophthora pseudosyringae]